MRRLPNALGFPAFAREARTFRAVSLSEQGDTAAATLLLLGMWGFLAVQIAELVQLTALPGTSPSLVAGSKVQVTVSTVVPTGCSTVIVALVIGYLNTRLLPAQRWSRCRREPVGNGSRSTRWMAF